MVEVITQWPGHAAEEIERLVTVPTEVEMNGVPQMSVMRSISLYGLSDVIMTFNEGTDDYFAREVVFQRLSEVAYPQGVTPTLSPLASPSGLVYRYVLVSPDRTPQELKTFEDWVVEREYKQVTGVADDSGFGGTVMQYQVLLDPAKLYAYHLTVPTVIQQLSVNNSNAGGGFYSQGDQFYYVRGLGLVQDTADIGNIVVGSQNGTPIRIQDIGEVVIGNAPRLGEFGFNKTDDAVEGVIPFELQPGLSTSKERKTSITGSAAGSWSPGNGQVQCLYQCTHIDSFLGWPELDDGGVLGNCPFHECLDLLVIVDCLFLGDDVDPVLDDHDLFDADQAQCHEVLFCLGLRAFLRGGDNEHRPVHQCRTRQHRRHQGCARVIDKRDGPELFRFRRRPGRPALLSRRHGLRSARTCRTLHPGSEPDGYTAPHLLAVPARPVPVSAFTSVVFPWSTWPTTPIFTLGIVTSCK